MSRPSQVLVVEDNPGDVRLVQEALRPYEVQVGVAVDGIEALAYLHGEAPHADRKIPDLILLDLNMPRKDGRQVLSTIKQDAQLRRIPVVVMSTSESERDILDIYELHANAYIVKPIDFHQFARVVQCIEGFWLDTARLPMRSDETVSGKQDTR